MAVHAISLKVRFALLRVACDLIARGGIRLAVRAAIRREFDLHLQELRDEEHIVLRKIRKRRHALTAFFEHRRELLAFFIVQHERHSRQPRSLRATPVFAVTARAIFQKNRLAFFGRRRVRRGAKSEKFAHATSATAAPPAGSCALGCVSVAANAMTPKNNSNTKRKCLLNRDSQDWDFKPQRAQRYAEKKSF